MPRECNLARDINKAFVVTLIFARRTNGERRRDGGGQRRGNPAEGVLFDASFIPAEAPEKITRERASERAQRNAAEGCRVFLATRGRDNKEQVVARARSYSRHLCHVRPLVGLEETVCRGGE